MQQSDSKEYDFSKTNFSSISQASTFFKNYLSKLGNEELTKEYDVLSASAVAFEKARLEDEKIGSNDINYIAKRGRCEKGKNLVNHKLKLIEEEIFQRKNNISITFGVESDFKKYNNRKCSDLKIKHAYYSGEVKRIFKEVGRIPKRGTPEYNHRRSCIRVIKKIEEIFLNSLPSDKFLN